MPVISVILILLILIVVIGVGIVLVLNQESARKKRAMSVIQGGSGRKEPRRKDDADKRRADIAQKLKESKTDEEAGAKKKKATLNVLLGQAGLSISQKQFWLASIASMVAFVVLAKVFGASLFVVLMAGVTGLLGFPRLVLKKMAANRQKKFLQEFPDALEATVRLLKAGMPVSEAVLMISKEYSGPVGEEMSIIYDKQKIGVPMHEAALEATKRMPLPEMQMFATGLAIQAQTGASLSEVLMNLAGVIRARFRLKRKVKALSSEAIASAGIIGALPNLVALGLWFVNREYVMLLFTTPSGKIMVAGSVIWMCIGIMVMKIMINFKV